MSFDNLKAGNPMLNASVADAKLYLDALSQTPGITGVFLYVNPNTSGAVTVAMIPQLTETNDPNAWVDTSQSMQTLGVPDTEEVQLVIHVSGEDPQIYHNVGIIINTMSNGIGSPQYAWGQVLNTFPVLNQTGPAAAASWVSNIPEVKAILAAKLMPAKTAAKK